MADDVIEIIDIVDGDSLTSWLTGWSVSRGHDAKAARQVALAVAFRAAMRVVPFWRASTQSEGGRKLDLTALPVLRSLVISGVAARSATPEIYANANLTAYASVNSNATSTAYVASTSYAASSSAADAAYAAVDSADICYAEEAFPNRAADAAAALVWVSIRADCTAISGGIDVVGTPLWADRDNPLGDVWSDVKAQAPEPEWAFWIKWYDDALAGRAPDWNMLEQIALIESEVWEAGPVPVADAIAKIEAKFDLQKPAKPNATVIQNAVAQNLPAIPPQLEALIETIDAEIERLRGRNPKDDLEKQDLDQLKKTFETMRGAVAGLSKMLPTQGAPTIEAAEEMGGLLQVYQSELLKWPRENAADLVDSSCRVVLIGLTAGVLITFGLPALASTAVAGIAFGGKKLVGIGKALKDAAPTSG